MNFAATTSCPTKSPVRSSVASALHPLFAPRSPQTPSLPDARPHSDRFRCGGRESEFLAVTFHCTSPTEADDLWAIIQADVTDLIEAHNSLLSLQTTETISIP